VIVQQDGGRERRELGLAFAVGFFQHVHIIGVFTFLVVTVVYWRSYRIRLLPNTKEKGKTNIEQYGGTRMNA
jgi:hypothetical protein